MPAIDDINNNSLVIDLETLNKKYKTLLIQYKQSTMDYVNFLKNEKPCMSYNSNSTNVDQKCYNEIWKKAGCIAKPQDVSGNSYLQTSTLNNLIYDSFLWATETDTGHRNGCYGANYTGSYNQTTKPNYNINGNFIKNEKSYIIICVGTDGNLYSRQGLDGPWKKIQDDSNGSLLSLCTSNDGKTIIGCNITNNLKQKSSWDSPNWQGDIQSPCCVMSAAVGQDGTIVGVGMNNRLWTKPNLNGNWTQASSPGEWISSICIAPDGSIFCIGSNSAIFKKDSYKNLPSQPWQYLGNNTCCVKAITIAPDGTFIGVGTDNQLYTKASYKDLTTNWIGPYNSQNTSCCAVSITTVENYNINGNLITIPGSVYWGTSALSQNSSATLQDCQASCASTTGCSGATFNATAHGQPMCWLRGGDSNVSSGLTSDYAIVTEGKHLLMNIQDINQQLLDTNTKIQQKTVEGQPLYDKQIGERETGNKELVQQFDQLTKERVKFDKMVNEYQDLDQKQSEGDIHINKNYYSFIMLLGIAIIVIIVLTYFTMSSSSSTAPLIQSGGELGNNAYYFIFGIILVILSIYYYKNYFSI